MTTTDAPATERLPALINANGWFSLVSGTVLVAGAPTLDGWFDLPAWVIALVGLALLPYGVMLRGAAAAPEFDRRMASLATIGDVSWVIVAAVLLIVPNTMSAIGKWTLTIVTLAVLEFVLLQLRALRST